MKKICIIYLIFIFGISFISRADETYAVMNSNDMENAVDSTAFHKHGQVKTNFLGWGLAMANAGVEFDMASHWSFDFEIYYSAWNYFRNNLKFRTLLFRPEFRYWLNGNNEGLFFSAHAGLAWYNFAFMGKYRFQDYKRRSPTIGGGIGVGYRMPITADKRWHLEFWASAGAYHLYYDKYLNEPNGRLVGQEKKNYIGLDGVAVSLTYQFGLEKKTINRK